MQKWSSCDINVCFLGHHIIFNFLIKYEVYIHVYIYVYISVYKKYFCQFSNVETLEQIQVFWSELVNVTRFPAELFDSTSVCRRTISGMFDGAFETGGIWNNFGVLE